MTDSAQPPEARLRRARPIVAGLLTLLLACFPVTVALAGQLQWRGYDEHWQFHFDDTVSVFDVDSPDAWVTVEWGDGTEEISRVVAWRQCVVRPWSGGLTTSFGAASIHVRMGGTTGVAQAFASCQSFVVVVLSSSVVKTSITRHNGPPVDLPRDRRSISVTPDGEVSYG